MKKILSVIVSVIVSVGMNAQVVKVYENGSLSATYTNTSTNKVKVVFEEATPTTGTTKVKLDGTTEVDVAWVQLWSGGPKFATINVGQTVTDYSTITTETYSLDNVGGLYTWGGTTNSNGDTYSNDSRAGADDLSSDDDTATKLWGSAWRMPTQAELDKLTNITDDRKHEYCPAVTTWEWCDGETGDGHKQYVSGCKLKGYKVSGVGGYASNSVFFPAAGWYSTSSSSVSEQGSAGHYWSSSSFGGVDEVLGLHLSNSDYSKHYVGPLSRSYGYSVRAVLKE